MKISLKLDSISVDVFVNVDDNTRLLEKISEMTNKFIQNIDMLKESENARENASENASEECVDSSEDTESEYDSDVNDMTNDVDDRDILNADIDENLSDKALKLIQNKNETCLINLLNEQESDHIYVDDTIKCDRFWAHETLCDAFKVRSIFSNNRFVLSFEKKKDV
jgi:hypothetical protein